jgi:hypothetical protein
VSNVNNVDGLACILGCTVSSLPMKDLHLPLRASFKAKAFWDAVIEKFEHRLAECKRMYLPKGGRITLIKCTLSNLHTYFLSLSPIHVGVANSIEKPQQDFLWGGLGNEFKFHLVSWSKVYSLICEGGLGVRNLSNFFFFLISNRQILLKAKCISTYIASTQEETLN